MSVAGPSVCVMKILVATGWTQGTNPSDYHYCVEGELVWLQDPCDRDQFHPDDECGCSRGFAGAASHRPTTTAMVVESEMSRDDLVLAFATSLADRHYLLENGRIIRTMTNQEAIRDEDQLLAHLGV